MKRLLLCALPLVLLTAASPKMPPAASTDPTHYLDQFVDISVSPRDDFFHYAVGKWLTAHPIPANERQWGIGHVVQEETYQRLLSISQSASEAGSPHGTNDQKIGDFWHAAMDSAAIARQG